MMKDPGPDAVKEFEPRAFAPAATLESKEVIFAYSDMDLSYVHGRSDPNGGSLNGAVEFAAARPLSIRVQVDSERASALVDDR